MILKLIINDNRIFLLFIIIDNTNTNNIDNM